MPLQLLEILRTQIFLLLKDYKNLNHFEESNQMIFNHFRNNEHKKKEWKQLFLLKTIKIFKIAIKLNQ